MSGVRQSKITKGIVNHLLPVSIIIDFLAVFNKLKVKLIYLHHRMGHRSLSTKEDPLLVFQPQTGLKQKSVNYFTLIKLTRIVFTVVVETV